MLAVRTSPESEFAQLQEDFAALLPALVPSWRLKAELRFATVCLTSLGELPYRPARLQYLPEAVANEVDRIAKAVAANLVGTSFTRRRQIEARFAKDTLAQVRRINVAAIATMRQWAKSGLD